MRILTILLFLLPGILPGQSTITTSVFPKTPCEVWIWKADWDDRYLGMRKEITIRSSDTIVLDPGDYVLDYRVGDKSVHSERLHIPKEQISFHKELYLNKPKLTSIRVWRETVVIEF